jgi:hypothetical protein
VKLEVTSERRNKERKKKGGKRKERTDMGQYEEHEDVQKNRTENLPISS